MRLPHNTVSAAECRINTLLCEVRVMRRKRFKHQVYIFCHMFCGWQLANDFEELNKLSSGCLEIDVKTGECLFNGENNSNLTMPLVLNDWLISDLDENGIQLSDIDSAKLLVKFSMNEFGKKNGIPPEFQCSSKLVSGGDTYTLEYKGENSSNEVAIT